ncbi:MAG: NAD-dependent epimerase/dehydratase family protein [Rhodospirillales bacterium]|nr:NAD-dependent epimerase/dehydratase family protein [Rhodospirillales bacterium]
MSGKAIAVTGGAGFIGRFLAGRLVQRHVPVRLLDVQAPSHDFGDFQLVDIRDGDGLRQALKDCSTVYHLAAAHRDDVRPTSLYADVNINGTRRLIESAEALQIKRIIFTSTVAVYGLGDTEFKEDNEPAPFNEYGRTKLAAEIMLREWASRDPARSLVIIRLAATFGPGNKGNIHTLIEQIRNRHFVLVGAGQNRKSIAYVQNVADFLVQCEDFLSGMHVYNYCDKPDLTTNELVSLIRRSLGFRGTGLRVPFAVGLVGGVMFDAVARLTGGNFPISAVRIRKFCADTVVNAERAYASGFIARHSLPAGLER